MTTNETPISDFAMEEGMKQARECLNDPRIARLVIHKDVLQVFAEQIARWIETAASVSKHARQEIAAEKGDIPPTYQ